MTNGMFGQKCSIRVVKKGGYIYKGSIYYNYEFYDLVNGTIRREGAQDERKQATEDLWIDDFIFLQFCTAGNGENSGIYAVVMDTSGFCKEIHVSDLCFKLEEPFK